MPSCNDCGACNCDCSTRVITVKDDPELRKEYEVKQAALVDKIKEVDSLRELLTQKIHDVDGFDRSMKEQLATVFDIWRVHGKCSRVIIGGASDSGKLLYCRKCPLLSQCGKENKVTEKVVLKNAVGWLTGNGFDVEKFGG